MESAAIVTIMTALMTGAVAFTLGYWWAAIVEADHRPTRDTTPRPATTTPSLSVPVGDAKNLRGEVAKLIRYCNSGGNELPTEVVESLNEILAVVNKIVEPIKKPSKKTSTERERDSKRASRDSAERQPALSVDDINKLVASAEFGQQRKPSHINSRRYPLRVRKPLLPFRNRSPKKDEFKFVECIDVSAGGMALFVEDTSDFDTFLIGLGDADCPIVMLCHVVDERASVLNGMVGFRVSACFARRLDDRYGKVFQEAYRALESASTRPPAHSV